jgi:hypothetical protein
VGLSCENLLKFASPTAPKPSPKRPCLSPRTRELMAIILALRATSHLRLRRAAYGFSDAAPLLFTLPSWPTWTRRDVDLYSDWVLTWWRTHGKAILAWRAAARMHHVRAYAQLCALRKRLRAAAGDVRQHAEESALADKVQAALILRYNLQ